MVMLYAAALMPRNKHSALLSCKAAAYRKPPSDNFTKNMGYFDARR